MATVIDLLLAEQKRHLHWQSVAISLATYMQDGPAAAVAMLHRAAEHYPDSAPVYHDAIQLIERCQARREVVLGDAVLTQEAA